MAQAKADRKAAGKKAAATRQRKQTKTTAQSRGKKSASTRQARDARSSASRAKGAAGGSVKGLFSAAKAAGDAAVGIGKSAVTRAGSGKKR
jgi:hypothetical protein